VQLAQGSEPRLYSKKRQVRDVREVPRAQQPSDLILPNNQYPSLHISDDELLCAKSRPEIVMRARLQ
jgi:hypothetical protein